jgi:hypothetical protein
MPDHAARFWGTASNADKLNGLGIGDFITALDARFTNLVNFADVGYTVGYPNARLRVFNDSQLIPTIFNQLSDQIVFKTTSTGNVVNTPLTLVGANILPGVHLGSDIGSLTSKFSTVYATSFAGTATQADTLNVSGTYRTASAVASASTIVVRTSADEPINGMNITAGSIKANFFVGTATTAYYADLAEKYLADADYEIGTVVMVGGDQEVTASIVGHRALGVVSGNPAYMMNSELEGGTYIALKGRVPVKVTGIVTKGDLLIASTTMNGAAESVGVLGMMTGGMVFAIALESNDNTSPKLIEAVIL